MRTELRHEEKVLFETTKHWFVLAKPVIVLTSVVLLVLLLPAEYFEQFKTWLIFSVIGCAGYVVYSYYDRETNIWVVTNQRIIDEWGVFTQSAKESALDKINNVFCRQTLTGQLFNFGDIEIQTAAEQGATTLVLVSHPKKLQKAIAEAQQSNRHRAERKVEGETKRCPFCDEDIKAKAIVCRYCGRDLPPLQGVSHV